MRHKLKQQWQALLLAISFFTRIPVHHLFGNLDTTTHNQPTQALTKRLNLATPYFPLVGLLIGTIGSIVFVLSYKLLPQPIAVLLSMASTLLLTGAFHEDGLADSADGLGGGWEREQILTIMQDSRLGTYGSVTLLMALLLKFELLSQLNANLVPYVLIIAHSFSRLTAIWIIAQMPYAKSQGKVKPLSTGISKHGYYFANLIGLAPWLLFALALWQQYNSPAIALLWLSATFLPMLLVWEWWRHKLIVWLQGYTGDTLGASQQLTELAFYLGALSWSIYINNAHWVST